MKPFFRLPDQFMRFPACIVALPSFIVSISGRFDTYKTKARSRQCWSPLIIGRHKRLFQIHFILSWLAGKRGSRAAVNIKPSAANVATWMAARQSFTYSLRRVAQCQSFSIAEGQSHAS
jgi:hypothetical protein